MKESSSARRALLYVFTKSPYSNGIGQEGLDAVLIGAAFEQKVSLLFLYDGLYQLKTEQAAGATGIKQYTKTFQALEDFEVENIFVSARCMQARDLECEDLIIEAEVLNRDAIASLIGEQHRVFTF